jgi:hypothetical protein
VISHDLATLPTCANNPDESRTTNNGHLFMDVWNNPRVMFDRAGFDALDICQYCGMYAAARRPDTDTELVSYYAADDSSKRFAIADALSLKFTPADLLDRWFTGAELTLTTEDFSLIDLELFHDEAQGFGYCCSPIVLDDSGKHHRTSIWMR